MEVNQPTNIEHKMRGHKLRSGVDWYRMLKQNNVKDVDVNQGCGVISFTFC
jgi:hypothetical protein